jgi:hypothetical protein
MGHIIGQKMLERNNKAIKMGSGERARHKEGVGKQRERERQIDIERSQFQFVICLPAVVFSMNVNSIS